MSGKSTYIKQVALIVIMAQAGALRSLVQAGQPLTGRILEIFVYIAAASPRFLGMEWKKCSRIMKSSCVMKVCTKGKTVWNKR